MKKKNKKGFTLMELLVGIIILSIMIGIAIPSVMPTINASKIKALETAVETAGKYLTKQSELININNGTADKIITNLEVNVIHNIKYNDTNAKEIYNSLGFNIKDIKSLVLKVNTNGTACLKVMAIAEKGQYYTTGDWEKITSSETNADYLGLGGYYKQKTDSKIITSYGDGC